MVEDNSFTFIIVAGNTVVVSPRLRTRNTGLGRGPAQELTRRQNMLSVRGVRVAESAMDPPSIHPEPGRAPWQRRRVLRG